MSDLLIKGMKMPKPGVYTCELGVLDYNTAVLTIYTPINEPQKSYTLIPVQPHGRLIDETDVIKHFVELANDPWNQNVCTSWSNAFAEAAGDICDMPTIIEAEEGE